MRYDYATYRTEERAWAAVEDMYATGDATEYEDPQVERRNFMIPGLDGYQRKTRFVVTMRAA